MACFAMIGLFHPIVIYAEYYFTKNCWPVFLVLAAIHWYYFFGVIPTRGAKVAGAESDAAGE